MDREIQQRSARCENGKDRQLGAKDMETIGEASGKRSAYESHRGPGTQDHPEFFRPKAARSKERRQERRD